jgi:hypothetical protein
MRRDLMRHVHAAASASAPSLRVVGLVYTGLGGVAVLVLVTALAVMPTAPILQQVAEPARQAVSNLVQPTSDLVPSFMVPPVVQVSIKPAVPTPVPFVASTTLDITIDDVAPPDEDVPAEAPVEEPAVITVTRPIFLLPASVETAAEVAPDEQAMDEEDQPQPAEIPAAPQPDIVQPAEAPVMYIAVAEAPRALPTPAPTLTPQELKARAEQENQAAIDAAKAAQAQAKAAADAANQAAIDAGKAAKAAQAAAMADAALTLPTPAPASTKASTDAAKEAAAKAKAEANAANQAAIDAAKAAKAPKR